MLTKPTKILFELICFGETVSFDIVDYVAEQCQTVKLSATHFMVDILCRLIFVCINSITFLFHNDNKY